MINLNIVKLLQERLGPELSHDIIKFSQENPDAIPSKFMETAYTKFSTGMARYNGKLFEGLFIAILGRAGISHLILDAAYTCLPYSTIDVAIYTSQGVPILISLKSSLRERWKQSDLEFGRIRSLKPNAICVIATLEDAGMPLRLLENNQLLGSNFIVDCRVPSQWDKFLSKITQYKDVPCFEDEILGLTDYKNCS
jgi:hypothetical protein